MLQNYATFIHESILILSANEISLKNIRSIRCLKEKMLLLLFFIKFAPFWVFCSPPKSYQHSVYAIECCVNSITLENFRPKSFHKQSHPMKWMIILWAPCLAPSCCAKFVASATIFLEQSTIRKWPLWILKPKSICFWRCMSEYPSDSLKLSLFQSVFMCVSLICFVLHKSISLYAEYRIVLPVSIKRSTLQGA